MRQFFFCLMLAILTPTALLHAQNQGQLLVFVQPGRSISKDFIRRSLPQIESLAQGQHIPVKVVDATQGAPAEVTVTPSVFFKKNEEYTLFEGRYNDLAGLEKFVRSGGKSAPAEAPERESTMVWKSGRSTLAAHCEMHPIEGKANGFDKALAWEAMAKGMYFFHPSGSSQLPVSARSFYLDFFPEKTSDGLMLVQMSLYSEYDMDTPLFQSKVPSGSEWSVWQTAFEKAGKRLEVMLLAQVGSNENGDGFEFVKNSIPLLSWGSLAAFQPAEKESLMARRK